MSQLRRRVIVFIAILATLCALFLGLVNCTQRPSYEPSAIKVYQDATVLSSTERTATTASSDMNCAAVGMVLFFDVSDAGSGMVTPTLQYKDPASGSYVGVWTAAAGLNSATTATYLFYPSVNTDATANFTEAIDMPLPKTWRMYMTHANSEAITYTVGAAYILY